MIGAIQGGLPLVPRPYAALAAQLGIDEPALLERLAHLHETGVIKRMGLVVRHQRTRLRRQRHGGVGRARG